MSSHLTFIPIMLLVCLAISSGVMSCDVTTCRVRSSHVVSVVASLALATPRNLRFVFDMSS